MEDHKSVVLRNSLTGKLIALQEQTPDQPYSITHRVKLAETYRSLGYPDLAAGEAYKALLLVDEITEEGEYHDEVFEAATLDFLAEKMAKLATNPGEVERESDEDQVVTWAKTSWLKTAYDILIGCLLSCGCLRSAFDYNTRAQKAFSEDLVFKTHSTNLTEKLRSHFKGKGEVLDDVDVDEYPDKGTVRREQYPWNEFEPDRFSDECLQFLNDEMASVAPKLEVKVAELPLLSTGSTDQTSSSEVRLVKQLGVFAKEDISPGEQILDEKSLLTAVARLHDTYCDACSTLLPSARDVSSAEGSQDTIISCEECDEVFFCSIDCHDLAQDSYHPSLCGVDINQDKVPASEAADSLYSLLLIRALALAETQDCHPLELKEVRYIWGDYHGLNLDTTWDVDSHGQPINAFCSVPQTLSFSFHSNVLLPLHMLEKMDVNIFTQSDRYSTWVFNTLYAKFRGTASARQGLDGRPEIGAVHPLWCLANHSCDPNVSWEWQGSMKFWAREKLVEWEGRDAAKKPGLKKGEEVFSHYCDVRLPVKERREWAVGALGGDCVCERCVWEEAQSSVE